MWEEIRSLVWCIYKKIFFQFKLPAPSFHFEGLTALSFCTHKTIWLNQKNFRWFNHRIFFVIRTTKYLVDSTKLLGCFNQIGIFGKFNQKFNLINENLFGFESFRNLYPRQCESIRIEWTWITINLESGWSKPNFQSDSNHTRIYSDWKFGLDQPESELTMMFNHIKEYLRILTNT